MTDGQVVLAADEVALLAASLRKLAEVARLETDETFDDRMVLRAAPWMLAQVRAKLASALGTQDYLSQ